MAYIRVDVDFDDVADEMDDDELIEELNRVLKRRNRNTVLQGSGEGDTTTAQYVERAYLAVKNMPNIPRELSDMFWHVHDRAI